MSELWNNIKDSFNALPTWGKAVIGVVTVGASSHFLVGYIFKKSRKSPYKTDYRPNVVYLYQFPRAKVIPNVSPFALKLETWLRMAGIIYEVKDSSDSSNFAYASLSQNVNVPMWVRSREGQMPFVELNGIEYCDSSFIIRDLTKLLKKEAVDASLSDEQKAVSRAFSQMVENSTML